MKIHIPMYLLTLTILTRMSKETLSHCVQLNSVPSFSPAIIEMGNSQHPFEGKGQ